MITIFSTHSDEPLEIDDSSTTNNNEQSPSSTHENEDAIGETTSPESENQLRQRLAQ